MVNYIKFGTCLTDLLNITNIKNIQLANAINVDPSLISKWKTGKRKISQNSDYLKTITNYICSNVTKNYQESSIKNISNKLNICIDFDDYNDMSNYIYTLLLLSLQDSKTIYYPNSIKDNTYITETQANTCYKFGSIGVFELIKGEQNIINAGISLLKSIPIKPNYINESILITFFTELNSFPDCGQPVDKWNNLLLEVQEKGWSINKLININNDKERNTKIINELLKNIASEKYFPYFLNKYDILFHYREMILVPTIGALICFFNLKSRKIENAFLFKDMPSLEAFEDTFSLSSKHLTPLITNKANLTNTNLFTDFTAYEKLNGTRFAYNCYFNFLSIPTKLYDKILLYDKYPKTKKLSLITEERRNLKRVFNEQIENYKYIDIYSKEFIENLVKASKKPDAHLNSHDIYIILENIIYMLEKHENYSIALVNNGNINIFHNFSWVIKDSNAVLISNFHQKIKNDEKLYVSITEPTIVNYVTNCFMEALNEIAPINKEKKTVISWLKSQMQYLIY